MEFIIRSALAHDAAAIGHLAKQFAGYLHALGDPTDFQLTAETYLRDGFGVTPAFAGLVAENQNTVIGYLLYHFGYDSDRATRNLHIVDLYVDSEMRRQGVGRALMARVAGIAHEADAPELIWSVYNPNALATRFYEGLGAGRITDVFFMKMEADEI
jgi:ribosomal protein S18 acetylase RimI-like enzyme